MDTRFRVITTRLGALGLVATRRGLRRIYLPERSAAVLRRRLAREWVGAVEDRRLLPGLVRALRRYCAGRPVDFDVPIDLDGATPFCAAVWRACRAVRYGETISYGGLAGRIGRPRAARAVGGAMRRNPCPIVVPCHRVLAGDGRPGGYSGPGGVALKQRLLALEAAARRLSSRARGPRSAGRSAPSA